MQSLDTQFPMQPYDAQRKSAPMQWLIKDLWQLGKINAVAGAEKSGKSRLLAWCLVGCGTGQVFGLQTRKPHRILYLAGEETIDDVNARLTGYAALQGGSVPTPLDFIEAAAMRLDTARQRQWLEQKLAGNYDCLVIDPLRRVHAADENDSTQMAAIHNDLRRWSNKYALTIVLLHHTPKIGEQTDMTRIASWFRGSTDIAAILDTAQYVNRLSSDKIQVMRHGRFAPLPPLRITDLTDSKGFVRVYDA